MKRSEMIKLMVRELNNCGIVQYNLDEYVDQVLAYMEQAGMMPPERLLPLREVESLRQWSLSENIKAFHSWDKE